MKKRNIIRGFLVLVMVVMTGFFINLEITKADEKNTENYHLIPWDDGWIFILDRYEKEKNI